MANDLVKPNKMNASFNGMTQLPIVRQMGLLIGLAASIAVGVGVVLWLQKPNFTVLFSSVSSRDAGDITKLLERDGIPYKVDTDKGMLLVASTKVHEARMMLAAQGLPNNSGSGF